MKISMLMVIALMSFNFDQALARSSSLSENKIVNSNITVDEVEAAQKAWGKALIQISKDFDSAGISKAKKTAEDILDTAYAYDMGPVLFKPTLAQGEQTFRTTKEAALAYFVGDNKKYPNDSGFALKGWQKYDFKNAAVRINGNMALTMGNVMLTDKKGNLTKVDKTWAFIKDPNGKIKIALHHSSLPHTP